VTDVHLPDVILGVVTFKFDSLRFESDWEIKDGAASCVELT